MVLSISIIQKNEYTTLPWKNGKGKTEEIAIHPAGSSMLENNFLWRLSTAWVLESGSFSSFPAYDRYLAVVEGGGLRLESDGKQIYPSVGGVFKFSGDMKVECQLMDGRIKDLNLMVKQDQVQSRFFLQNDQLSNVLSVSGSVNFIFCLKGAVQIIFDVSQSDYILHEHETLRIDLEGAEKVNLRIKSMTSQYSLAVIELSPIPS
ncbi:MAG: HutD family protein [Oligoflexales bacterium]|nr:HutD family protein [Oligoflexales bacterium]